jgi:hypothetical protein
VASLSPHFLHSPLALADSTSGNPIIHVAGPELWQCPRSLFDRAHWEFQSQCRDPWELPDSRNHAREGLVRLVPIHRLAIVFQETQTFTKAELSNCVCSQRKKYNVHIYNVVFLEASLDFTAENVQETVEDRLNLLDRGPGEEAVDCSTPSMVMFLINCPKYQRYEHKPKLVDDME